MFLADGKETEEPAIFLTIISCFLSDEILFLRLLFRADVFKIKNLQLFDLVFSF